MKITATYIPTKWDEVDYGPILAGTKTTKASIMCTFSGDIEGSAAVEYLMFYSSFDATKMHESEANFVGIVQITGRIGDRNGTFTVREIGTFSKGVVSSQLEILTGSGVQDFVGLAGTGFARADSAGAVWTMDINAP